MGWLGSFRLILVHLTAVEDGKEKRKRDLALVHKAATLDPVIATSSSGPSPAPVVSLPPEVDDDVLASIVASGSQKAPILSPEVEFGNVEYKVCIGFLELRGKSVN